MSVVDEFEINLGELVNAVYLFMHLFTQCFFTFPFVDS